MSITKTLPAHEYGTKLDTVPPILQKIVDDVLGTKDTPINIYHITNYGGLTSVHVPSAGVNFKSSFIGRNVSNLLSPPEARGLRFEQYQGEYVLRIPDRAYESLKSKSAGAQKQPS